MSVSEDLQKMAAAIAPTVAPIIRTVALELLGIVAKLITSRDTARALLDAQYVAMEAAVDELEAAKLAARAALKAP